MSRRRRRISFRPQTNETPYKRGGLLVLTASQCEDGSRRMGIQRVRDQNRDKGSRTWGGYSDPRHGAMLGEASSGTVEGRIESETMWGSPGVLLVSGSDQVLGGGEERRESRRDEHSSGPERTTPRETGNRRSGQTGKRRRQARSKSLGVRSNRQERIRNARNEGIAADQEAERMNVGTEVNTEGFLDGRRFRVRARGAGMFRYSGYGLETRRSEPELGCSVAEAGGWYRATSGEVTKECKHRRYIVEKETSQKSKTMVDFPMHIETESEAILIIRALRDLYDVSATELESAMIEMTARKQVGERLVGTEHLFAATSHAKDVVEIQTLLKRLNSRRLLPAETHRELWNVTLQIEQEINTSSMGMHIRQVQMYSEAARAIEGVPYGAVRAYNGEGVPAFDTGAWDFRYRVAAGMANRLYVGEGFIGARGNGEGVDEAIDDERAGEGEGGMNVEARRVEDDDRDVGEAPGLISEDEE
ncbi:hypothetical protein BKA70DRAFT_1538969 [Coprinopsis sp. MPI-PUGE-AT-0042]|nr:hypothetical protein BKA70DRAFT_1538969 [Coprinopsis sp. MPI-PUGE-AT-0042]